MTANGFTVNDRPVNAQVDTLFTVTMLIYPDSIDRLGLEKERKSKQEEIFPFTAPQKKRLSSRDVYLSVAHGDDAIRESRGFRVMRDHQNGLAGSLVEIAQYPEHGV